MRSICIKFLVLFIASYGISWSWRHPAHSLLYVYNAMIARLNIHQTNFQYYTKLGREVIWPRIATVNQSANWICESRSYKISSKIIFPSTLNFHIKSHFYINNFGNFNFYAMQWFAFQNGKKLKIISTDKKQTYKHVYLLLSWKLF